LDLGAADAGGARYAHFLPACRATRRETSRRAVPACGFSTRKTGVNGIAATCAYCP